MPSPLVSAATEPGIAPGGGGGGSGGGVFAQAPRANAPVSVITNIVFFIVTSGEIAAARPQPHG